MISPGRGLWELFSLLEVVGRNWVLPPKSSEKNEDVDNWSTRKGRGMKKAGSVHLVRCKLFLAMLVTSHHFSWRHQAFIWHIPVIGRKQTFNQARKRGDRNLETRWPLISIWLKLWTTVGREAL